MFERIFGPAVEFGDLFRRKFVAKVVELVAQLLKNFALFFNRKFVNLLQNLGRTHTNNLLL